MTYDEWSKREDLTQEARELGVTPGFRAMLEALSDQVPTGFPARGQLVPGDTMAMELGRIEGFRDCIRTLRSMTSVPRAAMADLPSTFGAEEPQQ